MNGCIKSCLSLSILILSYSRLIAWKIMFRGHDNWRIEIKNTICTLKLLKILIKCIKLNAYLPCTDFKIFPCIMNHIVVYAGSF